MAKLITLRNIITLFVALSFTACNSNNNAYFSSSGELKSISSEDNSVAVRHLAELTNPETGQVIYYVTKK